MNLLEINNLITAIDSEGFFAIDNDYALSIKEEDDKFIFCFKHIYSDDIKVKERFIFYKEELITIFEAIIGVRERLYRNIDLGQVKNRSSYNNINICRDNKEHIHIRISKNKYSEFVISSFDDDKAFDALIKAISYVLLQSEIDSKKLQD